MWQVAESDDQAAADEFVERYPEYKDEFARRIRMVASLKGSRPKQAFNHGRFMPSANVEVNKPSKLAVLAVVLTVLAGSVLATIGGVRWFDARRTLVDPNSVTDRIVSGLPNNGVGGPSIRPEDGQIVPAQGGSGDPAIQAQDPFQFPVTIVASQTSLNAALDDIARQAGIQLDSAPGMEDHEIMLDYREVPAIEVLRSLGRNFGFTVFVQGDRVALLVPARDPSSGNQAPDTGLSGPPIDPNHSRGGLSPLPGSSDR